MPDQVIALVGSDGGCAHVSRPAATSASLLLRDLLDDQPPSAEAIEVPIPVTTGRILQFCAEHFTYRLHNKARDIERPLKDKVINIVDEVDRALLLKWDDATTLDVVRAAVYFNAPELLALASAHAASLMMDKSVDEIRLFLGLENDFTPEEIAQLSKEHNFEPTENQAS